MNDQSCGEEIILSPMDEVLAEENGDMPNPGGEFIDCGSVCLAQPTPSLPPLARLNSMHCEPRGRSKFQTTVRISSPFFLPLMWEGPPQPAMAFAVSNGISAYGQFEQYSNGHDAWFQVLFEKFPEPIFLLDPHDQESMGAVIVCNELAISEGGSFRKFEWSLSWPIIECNESAGHLNGYTKDELVGQPVGLIGPRTDDAALLEGHLATLQREKLVRVQGMSQRKDGTVYPVEISNVLVNLFGRELILSIHYNITDRKRIEAELEKLESCLRLHPHPILEFDADGKLTHCNSAGEMLSRSMGEENPMMLLPRGTPKIVKECLATGRNRVNCFTEVDERTIAWSFYPIVASKVVYVHGVDLRNRGNGAGSLDPSRTESATNATANGTAADTGEVLKLIRELRETIRKDRLVKNEQESREQELKLARLDGAIRFNPFPVLEFTADGKFAGSNPAAEALVKAMGGDNASVILPSDTEVIVKECLASGVGKSKCITQVGKGLISWSFYPNTTSQVVYAQAIDLQDTALNHLAIHGRINGDEGKSAASNDPNAAPSIPSGVEGANSANENQAIGNAPNDFGSEAWQVASEGLISVDESGKISYLNPAAERIVGLAASELIGQPLSRLSLITGDWAAAIEKAPESEASNGNSTTLELKRGDKDSVCVEANAWHVIREGKAVRTHIALRDISNRLKAERDLRKRDESLSLTQKISQMGSWELDLMTGSLEWSEETFHLMGYQPGEIAPSSEAFYAQVHPGDRDLLKQTRDQAAQHGKPYSIEYRIVRPDSSIVCLYEQADLVPDQHGQALRLFGAVQDISKRKQHEEQIRQLEKWEAIGRLAGGVAHDFNNILTDIRHCAKAIESSPNVQTEMGLQIKQLSAAVQRATNVTWHLLAHTRKQAMDFKPVDVNEVVNQAAQTLQRALDAQINLQLKLTPNLPAICADVSMLEQVLLNLVVNSRQSIRNGGLLTIETRTTEIDAGYVLQQPEARVGRYVCLSITDTSSGAEAATTSCLFEPFFTTKEVGPGGGLGLATVYGIVRQHQGWIHVFSTLGQGQTFTVYLPAQTTKPESLATESAAKPMWGGTETILLMEDEPLLRALAQSILERYGYQIYSAQNRTEALAIWEKNLSEIDLLLVNMTLTDGASGRDLAGQFKTQKPALKTLYASGYTLNLHQTNGYLKLGVNFLPKPYSATALAQAVRRCLDSDGGVVPENPQFLFEIGKQTHQ